MMRRTILLAACPALRAFQGEQRSNVPRLLSRVQPEYSEEARKARLNGSVAITLVVGVNGHAKAIQVARPLGLGLDEKAIGAVEKWEFQPGTRDGQAVEVKATVEVTFRLMPKPGAEREWYTQRVAFQTPPDATRPTLQRVTFPADDPPETG